MVVKFYKNTDVVPNFSTTNIDIDRRKFCRDLVEEPYMLRSQQSLLDSTTRSFIEANSRRGSYPKISTVRLGCPTNEGYITTDDPKWRQLVVDFYNMTAEAGLSDTRMLCDPGKVKPYPGDARPVRDFVDTTFLNGTDLSSHKRYLAMMLSYSSSLFSAEDVKIKMKQSTYPGGTYVMDDGSVWSSSDLVVALASKDRKALMRYAHRYKQVKEQMFKEQLKKMDILKNFIECDRKYFLKHFNDFLIQGYLNIYTVGYRLNSADKAVNFERNEKYDPATILVSKERGVSYCDGNVMVSGLADMRRLSSYYAKTHGNGFLGVNDRSINNGWFRCNSQFQILARRLIVGLEGSKYGLVSSRANITERYDRFINNNALGDHFLFIQCDRTNSDRYISSNFDHFIAVMPDSLQDLFWKGSFGVCNFPEGLQVVRGVSSGSWTTTLFTSLMGRCTSNMILSEGLDVSLDDITRADQKMFSSFEDYSQIGRYNILRYMDTDDLLIVIRSREPINFKEGVHAHKLKIAITADKVDSFFGFEFDRNGMRVSTVNMLYKMLFFEKPGFYWADVFKIAAILQIIQPLVSSEFLIRLQKFVEERLGLNSVILQSAETNFMADLKVMGLSPLDVLSEYSVRDCLYLGSMLNRDFNLSESNNLPLEDVQKFLDVFEKCLKEFKWL